MKLLIVDDSRLNRTMAKNYINASDLDIEIIEASSGEEAIISVETEEIDIILLDIIMPGIDGVETLKWLKNSEAHKHIKVIMFTNLSEKTLLQSCFDIGASDFIQKPIEPIEFIARIKSISKQRQLEMDTWDYIDEINKQKTIISDVNMHMLHQEKMASVGQLAAGVAHEINNPLGFISSNFKMLNEYIKKFIEVYHQFIEDSKIEDYTKTNASIKSEDFIDMIEDIHELFEETGIGVERVSNIVKSLRNFSRIDSTNAAEPYDVNQGLRDTLIIANNNIKYSAKVCTNFQTVAMVNANSSQINQVFLNLLINAAYAISQKYKNELGEICINTFEKEGHVVVEIIDTGCGMTQETLRDLFNPFFTTKPVGEGTGLGLSISYDIVVNKHKGRLEASSTLNEGTTFQMWLPINTY